VVSSAGEQKTSFSSKATVVDDTYLVECEYLDKSGIIPSQQYMALSLASLNPNLKKNMDDWNEFDLIGPLVIADHGVKIVQQVMGEGEDEDGEEDEEGERNSVTGDGDDLVTSQEDAPPSNTSNQEGQSNLTASFYLHKVVLILHKRFSGPDMIHTVTFHPEFIPSEQRDSRFEQLDSYIPPPDKTDSPLSLPPTKIGRIQFFVSNPLKGFLYDVMSGSLLSRYHYTSDSMAAFFTDSFLYIVTGMGLETWAVRNSFTEKLKNELALPDSLEFPDPSLFGFHPVSAPFSFDILSRPCSYFTRESQFISLKTVIATGNFLVLLTKHTHNDAITSLPSTIQPKMKRTESNTGIYGSPSVGGMMEGYAYGSSPVKASPAAKASPYRTPGGRTLSITTLTSFVSGEELKVEPKVDAHASTQTDEFRGAANWNLYVLNPISVKQLFEDIVIMVEESTNDAIKFLVLLEGYFLLQTRVLFLFSPFFLSLLSFSTFHTSNLPSS